jgi:RNA-directed DNA polymerase
MRDFRGGTARSSEEVLDKGMEQRGWAMEPNSKVNPKGEELMKEAKPFLISKREVWEAYQRVKANKGAAGIDEQSIAEFERDLKRNLYKLWNRMSSGSYFPPPVRMVKIPKAGGGERTLGIPTVADRIAQTVVKGRLEPRIEPHFHPNSFGYRPGRSALDAVGQARRNCWDYDWVLDLDVRGFFDNIDWELLMKAVRKHAKEPWAVLYIERWLKAPAQGSDGVMVKRMSGTPQGGVISPLLANLFLHYVFDVWMARQYPHLPFERYADDAIVHCRTKREAEEVRKAVAVRMQECRLELHPEKTKVVYCKDEDRRGSYPNEKFDFLGYTFRPRKSKNRWGKLFVNFSPAISNRAAKGIRDEIRSWRLQSRSAKSIEDLSRMFNPILRGWLQYYGRYYRSAAYLTMRQLDRALARWASQKYKRLRRRPRRARQWVARLSRRAPLLFAHWQLVKSGSVVGAV